MVTSVVLPGHRKEGDRPIILVEDDAQHDLVEVRAIILRMPALPKSRATAPFEIERGGVEESDGHLVEQRSTMRIQRRLDHFS